MGVIQKVFGGLRKKSTRFSTLEESQFFTDLSVNYPYPGQGDYLRVTAAMRAGLVIAQGIGQMPLNVKHTDVREVDGMQRTFRRDAVEEPAYKLLKRKPNDWMTSIEFREALTLHAVFTGAGRAIIRRGVDGRPLELLPLHPRWVRAEFDTATGEYIYRVGVAEYGIYGDFSRDDILEITNPRWDLVCGMDVTRYAQNALNLSQNIEGQQLKRSGQTAPYGIITSEVGQTTESMNKLKTAWKNQFGEGHGIAVVDFAAKFEQMMGTAQEQQTIENRKFQVDEVARAYGVFPQMLMHGDNMNFASVDAFFLNHWTHTIQPWAERWEQAIDRCLFQDKRKLSANFDEKVLLRTDLSSRSDYYARALGSGGNMPWMTQNEVREAEGFDPHPDGDILTMEKLNENQITTSE